jgi:hypothetical protein
MRRRRENKKDRTRGGLSIGVFYGLDRNVLRVTGLGVWQGVGC